MQRIKIYHQAILEWKDAQMEAIDKSFPNAFDVLTETLLFTMISIGVLILVFAN
jgi:hypothetical protein